MRYIKNQRGDTIIEVLLSVLVLGVIVTAIYQLANYNFVLASRTKQRTVATKLAEEQIEQLRTLSSKNITSGCIKKSTPTTNCKEEINGKSYDIGISTVPSSPVTYYTYTITVTWDVSQKIVLLYRQGA